MRSEVIRPEAERLVRGFIVSVKRERNKGVNHRVLIGVYWDRYWSERPLSPEAAPSLDLVRLDKIPGGA